MISGCRSQAYTLRYCFNFTPAMNGIIPVLPGKAGYLMMKRNPFARFISVLAVLALVFSLPAGAAASAAGSEPYYSADDLFTKRDLKQAADLSSAETLTVADGNDVRITRAGVYVLTGTASGMTVYVEAERDDKVQLVLDNVHITNADFPCIYVVSGDKIFLTSASDSSFSVTGSFRTDNGVKTDSAVFSRQDLVLNGTASVTVSSTGSGVVSKDDLKITGGTWNVTADSAALKANDSVRIAGGTLSLTAGTDAIHAENNDDDVKGYIFISGGDITVKAGDDGIHAVSVLQIDGGVFDITAGEGLEATVVQFNGGTAGIVSSGDAVSAGSKSSSFTPAVVFNGGEITADVTGQNNADGVDSKGSIHINGGTVSITGSSAYDCEGEVEYNGGTVTLNGRELP